MNINCVKCNDYLNDPLKYDRPFAASKDHFRHLCEALGANQGPITDLTLQNNRLYEEKIELLSSALTTNKTLKSLSLIENSIDEAGARFLASALKVNNTLESLNLACTYPGAGLQDIVLALIEDNETLTSLNLCNNALQQTPGSFQDLGRLIAENRGITELNFRFNEMGLEGIIPIARALKEGNNHALVSLDLSLNQLTTESLCLVLEGSLCTPIAHLNFNSNRMDLGEPLNMESTVGKRCIAALGADRCSIQTFDLSYSNLSDTGVLVIATALSINRSITKIDLSYNKWGSEGIKFIAEGIKKNYSLKELNLSGYYGETVSLAKALKIAFRIDTVNVGSMGGRPLHLEPIDQKGPLEAVFVQNRLEKRKVASFARAVESFFLDYQSGCYYAGPALGQYIRGHLRQLAVLEEMQNQ